MQPEALFGEPFHIRRLQLSDKDRGFVDLLKQLTACDTISNEDFSTRFHELSAYGDDHVICVIEEDRSGQIVATGSVFVERKFIRNCGKVGHIEDVVVDSNFRGKHLGKKIIQFLSDHARSVGCYKVILDCDTEKMGFYEKFGFQNKGLQMAFYFN